MVRERGKNYFKRRLTQMLNDIQGKAEETLVDMNNFDERVSDPMDRACLEFDVGFALRIRDREAKLMRKIREALGRLEDGTFWICEECGEEIPLERLMARPVTTLCIDCKNKQESTEKSRATDRQLVPYQHSESRFKAWA